MGPTTFRFDRFRLDPVAQRLDGASGPIRLNHKAFAVLRTLVARAGELVTKDDLLDEVWANTHVADGVLKVCVAEIRRALGDSATEPRFVETVHRRGYRFVAGVRATSSAEGSGFSCSVASWPAGGVPTSHVPVGLVGRNRELALLDERLGASLRGERQVVFVTGEPGAGKTALVEHFAAAAARRQVLATMGSQCLAQLGAAEAYMPVLEAVGRLAREAPAVGALLRRYAPTWFAQLPWLIEDEDRERLGHELLSAARERMLREIGEFIDVLSAEIPLVVVLEDLHWSDPSTVDLLSLLTARREPARLLILATFRPVELILAQHPLRAVAKGLAAARRCREIALEDLTPDAVAEYLERRFAGSRFSAEVVRHLCRRTDGNPLFLTTLVEHLLAHGAFVERRGRWEVTDTFRAELLAVPESLRLLIEQQVERLGAEDRELLEGASLVGTEFSAAAAAVATDRGTPETEAGCGRLADAGPFLRHAGASQWPDGTTAGCYAFRHALYRETLAAAVSPGRRTTAQLRIGRRLEEAYGARSPELAAELAVHFEEGGDAVRAARYRRLAGETASRRYASAEAESHLERALALLGSLPASAERDREELMVQSMLGPIRMVTRGYGAPEIERSYARALELSGSTPDDPSTFPAIWGLWVFYAVRGELDRALELAERNRRLAEASGDRLMRLQAHQGLWTTHFFRGELVAALRHLDAGEPLYDSAADRGSALVYGTDPKAAALSYRGFVLWGLGHVDQAVTVSREAVAHARALGHPLSLGRAMVFATFLRHCRREPESCLEEAEATLAYAQEHALPYWMPHGFGLRGWALVERGEVERGTADVERSLQLWQAIGASLGRTPFDANLAAIYARTGRLAEARALLETAKAQVDATGERFYEPEILRLDAHLMLAEAGGVGRTTAEVRARAASRLDAALECARRQGARTLELRAATALARLCAGGTQARAARGRVAELLDGFSEGFDTIDLQEAREQVAGRR